MAVLNSVEKYSPPAYCLLGTGAGGSRFHQTYGCSSLDGYFPNGFRRFSGEKDGMPIRRPRWTRSIWSSGRKSRCGPAIYFHCVEFRVAGSAQIEGDAATIRRPTRRSNLRPSKRSQLNWIRSVAITDPDFLTARAAGLEGDVFAVRRNARVRVAAAGRNEFGGRACRLCLAR